MLFNIYFNLLLVKKLQLVSAEGCSLYFSVQAVALPIVTSTMSTDLKKNVMGSHGGEDPNIHSLSIFFWVPVAWPHLREVCTAGTASQFQCNCTQHMPTGSQDLLHPFWKKG